MSAPVSRILVLYSSNEGQTAKIAARIAEALGRLGHRVSLEADAPAAFEQIGTHDAVVIGAAIRYGHHARPLEKRIKAARAALAARPNAFFSVCLSAGGPGAKPETAAGYLRDFARTTGWTAQRATSFAGALLYPRYNPFIRFMMRLIVGMAGGETDTSREYEYTDWQAVERFAAEFAAGLTAGSRARAGSAACAPGAALP